MKRHTMKTIKSLFAIAALACLFGTIVLAEGALPADNVDFDFSGEIDTQTGKPLYTEDDENAVDTEEGKKAVLERDVCDYDLLARHYVNYIDKNPTSFFYTSVLNNFYSNEPVKIELVQGNDFTLYKDGEEMKEPNLEEITEHGTYVLTVFTNDKTVYSEFVFSIVTKPVNYIKSFPTPTGFFLSSYTLDAKEQTIPENGTVQAEQDGRYALQYSAYSGDVVENITVTIDRQAPTLALDNVIDGVAESAVSLAGMPQDTIYKIFLDDAEIPLPFNFMLTAPGQYLIDLSDEANNTTRYEFIIKVYFTVSSAMVFVLIAGAIIGIFVYSRLYRKKVRIR